MKKFILTLITICVAHISFAGSIDTNKHKDTVTLPLEQIQIINYKCTVWPPKLPNIVNTQVFNSKEEFDEHFSNDCSTIPQVDFSLNTLLYFPIHSWEKLKCVNKIEIIGDTILDYVNTIHPGKPYKIVPAILIITHNMIAIPKIKKGQYVKFIETETYRQDSISKIDTVILPQEQIKEIEPNCANNLGGFEPRKDYDKPRVINTDKELDTEFIHYCPLIPEVSYSASTLLWYPIRTGGGGVKFKKSITIIGDTIFYHVTIVRPRSKAGFDVAVLSKNIVAIPKIREGQYVKFEKSDLYVDDK